MEIREAVLERYNATRDIRTRIRNVADYDLDFLTRTFNDDLIRAGRPFSVEQVYPIIARFGRADFEIASRLEEEFRRFVAITLLTPRVPHAPPGAVDMYWHFFILHTERYMKFSEEVWGSFLGDPKYRHHYPATDDTRAGMLRAYWTTLVTYQDIFGEPEPFRREGALPAKIWTERSETSGDSYSGLVEPGELLKASDFR